MVCEQVDTRRVELYQLFKDFDRSTAYTRLVTPTQFGRILTTLSVCSRHVRVIRTHRTQ